MNTQTRVRPSQSALDRPLTITKFWNARALRKKAICVSLRELAEKMPRRVADSKDALPLVKLGRLGNKRSRKGSLRHNANMVAIDGVEGDYDGEELSVEDAAAMMRDAEIAAVFYTSPSHTPETPRWRIFCPTSCELAPSERERLIARMNGVLGGALARESFTLSQSYYYGSVEGQPASQVELVEGQPIDLADELDAIALDKNGLLFNREEPEAANDDDFGLAHEPDVERIRKALDNIPIEVLEPYQTWLSIGQALEHEFDGAPEGMELWDEASQLCPTYDREELEAKWASFGSYSGKPITIATIYRLAEKHSPEAKIQGAGPYFISTEECANAPARDYVVKALLTRGDVACIFGEPGAGKSLIAPYIGYQVALGEFAFGMRTKQGTVFYCAAEDTYGMQGRVRALAQRRGDHSGFQLIGGISNLSAGSEDLEWLAEQVADQCPSLIIIDTLAIAFPGLEENDAASMGGVIAVARKLAEHGAAVILIHHGTKADGSTPRGSGVFNGALDVSMHLAKGNDGIIRGTLKKNKRGTTDRDIAFRIQVVDFGPDEDGDPITAALVEELTGSAAARPKELPASQREALAILEELEAEVPVSNVEWANVCAEGFRVSQSENQKLRRDAFNRARRGLAQSGLIEIDASGNVQSASRWCEGPQWEDDDD